MNELTYTFQESMSYTIESGMLKLAEYGKPRLVRTTSGWYCCIEMFVQGKGVQFEISSEFHEATMLKAVQVCIERVYKAFKDLGLSK